VRQAAALAALLGLAGCPRAPPPDLSADPAELLAAVRARDSRVLRVSGRARLRVEGAGSSASFEAMVAAERPDRLRLDLLDFFGSPVARLSVSGGRFALLDARRRTWIRGRASPRALGRLLGVPLPVEDLVAAACGTAVLIDGRPVGAVPGRGVMELVLEGGGREQRLEVGGEAALVSSRLSRPGGGPEPAAPELDFAAFARRQGLRFPGEVVLAVAGGRFRAELRYGPDLALNGPGDPALFATEVPAGAPVEELDEALLPRLAPGE